MSSKQQTTSFLKFIISQLQAHLNHYLCLALAFVQIQGMDDEDFDQFEEATYSAPTQQPSLTADPQPYELSNLGQFNLGGIAKLTIETTSNLVADPLGVISADDQLLFLSPEGETMLGQISSVGKQEEGDLLFRLDLQKTGKEELNEKEDQQFMDFGALTFNQPSSQQHQLSLSPNNIEAIQTVTSQIEQIDIVKVDYSSQNYQLNFDGFQDTKLIKEQPTMETFAWQSIALQNETNLQANHTKFTENELEVSAGVKTMERNMEIVDGETVEKRVGNLEINEPAKDLQVHNSFGEIADIAKGPLPTQQIEFHFGLDFKSQTANEVGEAERKQSEEFVFEQSNQINEVRQQARKQSEQFVFQTHPADQIYHIHQQEASQQQPIHQQSTPIVESGVDSKRQVISDEEDEFGDFEESTAVILSKSQNVEMEQIVQDNQVQLNENYGYPPESEKYKVKERQLQQFVNSLPDYSFLFAKAFL